MSIIGDLTIRTGMATSAFSKGVKSTIGGIQSLKSVASSASGAIVGLGAAIGIGLSAGALASMVKATGAAIDETAKLADRIGTSTESLLGLSYGAGLSGTSTEDLSKALEKMNVNLAKASEGTGPTADALSQIGLSANDLMQQDPAEAMKQIADGINGLPNPAMKAQAAMAILGKSGIGMLNFLQEGSEGIQKMIDENEALGGSFSRVDAAQVEMANDAMSKIDTVLAGVKNQITIAVAPAITALADSFTNAAKGGVGMGDMINTALEWIVGGVAIVADVIHTIYTAFLFVRSGVTKVIAFLVDAIAMFAQSLEWLINKIPGVQVAFGDTFTAISEDLHKLAGEQFDDALETFDKPPGEKIHRWFDDVRAKSKAAGEQLAQSKVPVRELGDEMLAASEDALKLIEKLQLQIDTFGMSGDQAELYKLKLAGANEELVSQAESLQSQVKALEDAQKAQEDMASRAKSIFDETRTPLEKFQEQMLELNELFAAGAIDADTFGRASEKAKEDLLGKPEETTKSEMKLGGALMAGSAEARSAILGNRLNPFDKMEKKSDEQIELQTQMRDSLVQLTLKTGVLQVLDF